MPNIKSAKKRVIVNNKRAQRNKSMRSALKTAIKKANVAIETGAADKEALVTAAVKKAFCTKITLLVKSPPSFAN